MRRMHEKHAIWLKSTFDIRLYLTTEVFAIREYRMLTKVTKGKLEREGARSHKHTMTKERIDLHVDRYVKGLLDFTKQLEKAEQHAVLMDVAGLVLKRLKIDVEDLRVHGKPFLQLVA
jgi:hypothetical protein